MSGADQRPGRQLRDRLPAALRAGAAMPLSRLSAWSRGLRVSGRRLGACVGTAAAGFLLIAGLVQVEWSSLIDGQKPARGVYFGSLAGDARPMLSPPPPTAGHVRDELDCLARNVYFEARGESDMGKRAVAHVVMNRVLASRFPATVCDVVRQGGESRRYKCQFSWWCDGRSDRPTNRVSWRKSQEIAREVYWGWSKDPTRGALWYHTAEVRPSWREAFVRGVEIGNHLFYVDHSRATQVASRALFSFE